MVSEKEDWIMSTKYTLDAVCPNPKCRVKESVGFKEAEGLGATTLISNPQCFECTPVITNNHEFEFICKSCGEIFTR